MFFSRSFVRTRVRIRDIFLLRRLSRCVWCVWKFFFVLMIDCICGCMWNLVLFCLWCFCGCFCVGVLVCSFCVFVCMVCSWYWFFLCLVVVCVWVCVWCCGCFVWCCVLLFCVVCVCWGWGVLMCVVMLMLRGMKWNLNWFFFLFFLLNGVCFVFWCVMSLMMIEKDVG